jgi:(S)-2-hydroxy-acid oxidase
MLSHQPVCVDDIREIASLKFDRNAHGYFFSGAEDEQSLRDNVAAFKRYRLRPRFLHNVSHVSTRTSILGEEISFPVCVAPTGLHCMAHPDGERATARACANLKTCMVLSSGSTTSIEDVGTASGGGLRWFQLYILKNRDLTFELIKRAESSGYKALVVTIDAPVVGKRYADVRNKFFLPPHLVQVNYSYKGVLTDPTAVHKGSDSPQHSFTCDLFDSTITWKDIDWVKSVSSLPVVLKGILSSEDALLAVNHGLNGIIVSNHGGRQLDGVPATVSLIMYVHNFCMCVFLCNILVQETCASEILLGTGKTKYLDTYSPREVMCTSYCMYACVHMYLCMYVGTVSFGMHVYLALFTLCIPFAIFSG